MLNVCLFLLGDRICFVSKGCKFHNNLKKKKYNPDFDEIEISRQYKIVIYPNILFAFIYYFNEQFFMISMCFRVVYIIFTYKKSGFQSN